MSKYKDWLSQQDSLFVTEVCRTHEIPKKFKDYGTKPISLAELKQLDEKYINCESETH